ncbi:ferredoxin [Streptomyces sp. NPDC088785]|uniref:ferredoxin n=1 Tax=Streptomyces sp. NPDC088785 TaxID=3365897 RepID=UPI003829403B
MTPLTKHANSRAEEARSTERASTGEPSKDALVRYLEDRFACAQSCTECARSCAVQVSSADRAEIAAAARGPAGPPAAGAEPGSAARPPLEPRRTLLLCVEVCDATCRLLSEENLRDEYALRLQVEWCRAVALECAHACDRVPAAEETARRCRACARACTDFLATLG